MVDGEIVAFAGRQTSFRCCNSAGSAASRSALRVRPAASRGLRATALPLHARRRLLRGAVAFDGPLRLTPSRKRDGERLSAEACRKGWEGLIAKRADAPYTHGRSRDWLKFKCTAEQELVIGGYTAPRGSRSDLGALLLGHFADGHLRYAGKVGTGFTAGPWPTWRRGSARCAARPHRSPTRFASRDVTWVEPRLVAQIGFTEWTRDGRLRHPRFLGLRDDKAAEDVGREAR